ncbi:hypothetical protein SH668x_001243 [Planctomicrobium sp. SH668]|uniref:hypothetical protein n=1 Tax=Planctomicrobium sp. SH668 TaxID=3448126 RepID=UPI003F5B98A3
MDLLNRDEIEAKYQMKADQLSAKHRRELVSLMGSPPDINKVPRMFWLKVKEEEEALLLLLLGSVYLDSSQFHGGNNLLAQRGSEIFASKRANAVSSSYVENSYAKAMVSQRQQISANPGSSLTRMAAVEIADKIFSPVRNRGIITTEVTAASVAGGERAAADNGAISTLDLWITNANESQSGVCKRCEPLHETPRQFWQRVHPAGPPIHPSCKCRIRYATLAASEEA